MRSILARLKQYGEPVPSNYDEYLQIISGPDSAFRQKGWLVEKGSGGHDAYLCFSYK